MTSCNVVLRMQVVGSTPTLGTRLNEPSEINAALLGVGLLFDGREEEERKFLAGWRLYL